MGLRLAAAAVSIILPGLGLVWLGRRRPGTAVAALVLGGVMLAPWLWFGVWVALAAHLGGAVAALVWPRGTPLASPILWRAVMTRLGLVVLLRLVVNPSWVAPYQIPSGSMFPTLETGDRVFVSKFDYGLQLPMSATMLWRRSPARGDVIVFRSPRDNVTVFVKRVVAVAGDEVAVRDGQLVVNGSAARAAGEPGEPCVFRAYSSVDDAWEDRPLVCYREHGYRVAADPVLGLTNDLPPTRVPPGTVFVLGDNRDNAEDSRAWGPVPLEHVIGRVRRVWSSVDEDGHTRWSRLGVRIR